ncbi:S53 family peptidase [Aspergillus homomorphus CBS 101889]|uniref:Subtilisin-like protein n=1 Tax=Aspergillus homomorphus (strain CBS 101889) TaxID=1450537 RepID=A0A395HMK0_ASPHC|nr:subtilisin-like protein [Aspergillus homomorphus CBS 101889]RAL08475.1 subtilisin-like protein [Aspergillus homomorphus CBS 101889]
MRFLSSLCALSLVTASVALPKSDHVLHEKRSSASTLWEKTTRVNSTETVIVRIGLTQSNLDRGYEYLMDVSDSVSPNYGKFWTAEKVAETFAPSNASVEAVRNWLIGAGVDQSRLGQTKNKAWIVFNATTEEAEALLHTQYYYYRNKATGSTTIATDQYRLPQVVQPHVDYIKPGVLLPLTSRKRQAGRKPLRYQPAKKTTPSPLSLATCDQAITPACIAALYKIPASSKNVSPNNSLGIFEEGDYYSQEDLNLFFQKFTRWIPQGTHPKPAFIDGAEAPVPVDEAGTESDLDFQLAYPIVYPQEITLFQTDDSNYASQQVYTSGFLNTFLDALDGVSSYCTYCADGECGDAPGLDPVYPDTYQGGYTGQLMCGTYKPTNVISISYGSQEEDLPDYYQKRQCNEFLKLGLQGTSILIASGDDGVAGPPGDDSNDGCLGNGTVFSPAFPNSCPWITNVGATKLYPGHTVADGESAAYDPPGSPYRVAYASGGGFSNIYPIPDYQSKAVAEYLKKHNPPYPYYKGGANLGKNGGVYNRLGRGYPDVAANGDNIAMFNGAKYILEGGTSASTPIFASVINRIIEKRIAAGKGPVGFLNPVLYRNAEALNDITNGTNPGCGTDGFSTAPGWDPVTGLGTPNFPKLLDVFLNLP